MTKLKKISILVPTIQGGGAEKMMTSLAKGIATQNYDVDLVILTKSVFFSQIEEPALNIINIESKRVLTSILPLAKYLLKRKPDIIITSLSRINVAAVILKKLFLQNTKLIIRESNTFSAYYSDRRRFWDRIINFAALKLYKYCDISVAVSKGVEEDLRANVDVDQNKIRMIYNPVVDHTLFQLAKEPVDSDWLNNKQLPVVIAVGRISPQKDFSTLIKAFNEVQKIKDSRLMILGYEKEDLSEFYKLQKLISEFNIQDKVKFTGYVDNPFAYMSKADVFVLSSRYEGLPGVLIQAMACGTTSVSTDCPSGPKEILDNGKFGRLVDIGDYESLSKAILESFENPHDSDLLIKRASEYSVKNSIEKYNKVFDELFLDESGDSEKIPATVGKRKLKVVHFINSFGAGGAEVLVKDIAILQSELHDVQIWGMHYGNNAEFTKRFIAELRAAGIESIPSFGDKPNSDRIKRTINIRRAIKKYRPDVINTHSEVITAYVVVASFGFSVKIAQTIHSVKILYKALQKYFLKYNIDRYVSISEICNQAIVDDINTNEEMTSLIYNGIDPKKFQVRDREIEKNVNNIIAIGRLTVQKDFETLINAYLVLKNKCAAESIKLPILNIAGEGELKEKLIDQRDSLGLTNEIHFLGIRNDIPELLYQNDLLVMSSIYEGLSIALLEAISTGIPVVATDAGGNSEIIEDEFNGLLVETKNPEMLAEAIFKLLQDSKKRKIFSMNSLNKWNKFNIKTTVKKYASLHEELASH